MLPAATRVPLARRLVADFNYFVIHAPRQTGKTTSMIALAQELTASGAYVAALVSVEMGTAFNSDPGAGYTWRPTAFPTSLALIGMRDVRDYKVVSGGSERLNTASPFNVKTRSLTLGSFTRDDVARLYQQHTDDTGQVFASAAIDHAFALTQGQPWLVNDLREYAIGTRRHGSLPALRRPTARHDGHGTQGLARRRKRSPRRGAGPTRPVPGRARARARLARRLRPPQRPPPSPSAPRWKRPPRRRDARSPSCGHK
nr:hypothetical protein [Candidatus Chloroploca sp. Khr17]